MTDVLVTVGLCVLAGGVGYLFAKVEHEVKEWLREIREDREK